MKGEQELRFQIHELWKDIRWRNKLEKRHGEEQIVAKKAEIVKSLGAIYSNYATKEQKGA